MTFSFLSIKDSNFFHFRRYMQHRCGLSICLGALRKQSSHLAQSSNDKSSQLGASGSYSERIALFNCTNRRSCGGINWQILTASTDCARNKVFSNYTCMNQAFPFLSFIQMFAPLQNRATSTTLQRGLNYAKCNSVSVLFTSTEQKEASI